MNIKKILIIDDEPQGHDIQKIQHSLYGKVIISHKQIDVLDPAFLNEEANLVPTKLEAAIISAVKSYHDLVLVDYDYGLKAYNGLDVIDVIRKVRKKCDVILYSADQKSIIDKVLGDDLTQCPKDKIIEGINQLMNYRILKIGRRGPHIDDAIQILKRETLPSPRALLCEMLRTNGDRVFNSCCPKLKGKTFSEIADILDDENNANGHKWLTAIMEQVIAYLVEVNE